jgi:ribonuclease HII
LRAAGFAHVAGADEVGCGPLAGPLVAAAVVLAPGSRLPGVDDSKKLTPHERERWSAKVRDCAIAWSICELPVEEVDALGPYRGSIVALTRAVLALDPAADYLLVDARRLPDVRIPQEPVIGGDRRHLAIAAASVVAKVYRDARMVELDELYPGYGFARHKGYGTAEHLVALTARGPCPAHRRHYRPVREALGIQPSLF